MIHEQHLQFFHFLGTVLGKGNNSGRLFENFDGPPHENRVHTLKKEADRCIKMAELIEYNQEDVDAAILAVRVALANGMNWEDLARMVKEEKNLEIL
ncbi:hypothetical protein AAG906_027778 [Vitis piasezkii]